MDTIQKHSPRNGQILKIELQNDQSQKNWPKISQKLKTKQKKMTKVRRSWSTIAQKLTMNRKLDLRPSDQINTPNLAS